MKKRWWREHSLRDSVNSLVICSEGGGVRETGGRDEREEGESSRRAMPLSGHSCSEQPR